MLLRREGGKEHDLPPLGAGVTVFTVEKAGRRPLLLGGTAAMTAALAGLAVQQSSDLPPSVAAAALLLYVGAYQVGCG